MTIQQEPFGTTPEGDMITAYTLSDGDGIEVKIINYGAIVVSLKTPDRNGVSDDIVLGYDTLDGYRSDTSFFGATIGRYANRIAGGRFSLNGVEYTLAVNDGPNHLHGGPGGFHKVVWSAEPFEESGSVGLRLTYLSPDGEEGYPGNLNVTLTYTLTDTKELRMLFEATTDKDTPVNLTHHGYFNLTGSARRDILDHELMLAADNYTPVDDTLIPTGEITPVKATDMDFTTPMAIGARIANVPGGYDHNYVLTKDEGVLSLAARVYEPESGRVMEISTTEPGIQFYSGNFMNDSMIGKGGNAYDRYYAFCLEPQHFPDSPNQPQFPSTILSPGEKYEHLSVFRFSTR